MIEFDNDIDQFMKKYNIEERTWDLFWSVYNKYIEEEKEKAAHLGLFDTHCINPGKLSVCWGCFNEKTELITVSIEVSNSKFQFLGTFDVTYDIFGNYVDDYFLCN